MLPLIGRNPRLERLQLAQAQAYAPSRVRGFSGQPVANRDDDDPDEIDPTTGAPISEKEKQDRKDKKVADQRKRDKDAAESGTPVASPGSSNGAIGPMKGGDGDGVQDADKLSRKRVLKKISHLARTGMSLFEAGIAKQLDDDEAPAKRRDRNDSINDAEEEGRDADTDEGEDEDVDQRERLSRRRMSREQVRNGVSRAMSKVTSGIAAQLAHIPRW